MKRFEALAIEGWSPEYGSAVESEREEVPAEQVDPGVELAADEWRALGPEAATAVPANVYFVDGVRRIEARVWMSEQDESRLGICASFAAGVVRCGRRAEIVSAEVRRGFFGRAGVPDLVTRVGIFPACVVADDDIEQLVNGLQERMGQLEVEVAGAWDRGRITRHFDARRLRCGLAQWQPSQSRHPDGDGRPPARAPAHAGRDRLREEPPGPVPSHGPACRRGPPCAAPAISRLPHSDQVDAVLMVSAPDHTQGAPLGGNRAL